MAGKLFVIDGVDGSGKNTQASELYMSLIQKGYKADEDIALVSFPRYNQPSAKFVEMYLHGEFSKDPMDMDPYTASLFYTIDRSISFKTEKWGEVYRNGGIVIADRYFTSNIIHQGAKIISKCTTNVECFHTINRFTYFLNDLEVERIGIPNPDKIFWLMTDKTTNNTMMQHRVETNHNHIADIHESHNEYLNLCRKALQVYKEYYEYTLEYCDTYSYDSLSRKIRRDEFINVQNENGEIRSVNDIHNEIVRYIDEYLNP